MTYEFAPKAPKPISEDEYCNKVLIDYKKLLNTNGDDELIFQNFLEKNPCMVPGARDEFCDGMGSGNGPLHEVLIAEPRIYGIKKRFPDFMWLALDSLNFCPVLIEIEAPNKTNFKKDETPNAKFNHALHQITQWQAILSKAENQQRFYEDFNIPQYLRDNNFRPHFILIYGRRSEYENNIWLRQQRAAMQRPNLTIMSFDRISPQIERRNYLTCSVKKKKYHAKYLSPTFYLGPYEKHLIEIENLISAVDGMDYTTLERKAFLKKRIPYCLEYLTSTEKRVGSLIRMPRYNKTKE